MKCIADDQSYARGANPWLELSAREWVAAGRHWNPWRQVGHTRFNDFITQAHDGVPVPLGRNLCWHDTLPAQPRAQED